MENIKLKGKTYEDVPSVTLPTEEGGTAEFIAKSNLLLNGVLRPDAEVIQTYSLDSLLVENEGITLPSYSTTATTLKASESFTTTVTLDYANYNYFVVQRMLTIPIYSVTTKAKGRQEYSCTSYFVECAEIPANTFSALVDGKIYTSRSVANVATNYVRDLYWSSASALAVYTATTYGVAQVATAPTISSGVLTVKSPSVTIRGHTTYFTSTFYNALTDIRIQYVIEVYRAPKSNLNLDGWGSAQNMIDIINCATGDQELK